MHGHKEEVCKKKDGPRKEWRVKQKENVMETRHTLEVLQAEDNQNAHEFTRITRGVSVVVRTNPIITPRTSNSY